MRNHFWIWTWIAGFGWSATAFQEEANAAFLEAVAAGKPEAVRVALASGADIEARNDRGWTALHIATNAGDTALMALLLIKGADPDATTERGLQATPLMLATSSENVKIGKLLLEHGAAINIGDHYGDHALNWAVYQGNFAYTKLLLEHGADPRVQSRHGRSLDIAMRRGFEPIMAELADALGLPPAPQSQAALVARVSGNALDEVRSDLEGGAPVAAKDRYGRPLIVLAALHGHRDMVRLLLESGADVNESDRIGFTALMIAARDGNLTLAETLLQAGAQINRTSHANSRKLSPLALAIIGNHEALIAHLLKNGASIDLPDANGNTPLILAVNWGRLPLVRLLLEKGARTDLKNDEGHTALQLARRYELAEMVRILESGNRQP